MTIFKRLFRMFLLVVFVPLVPVVLLTVYYQSYAKNNILKTHDNLAKMVASSLEQNIDNIGWRLYFADDLPKEIKNKNKAKVEAVLQDALVANPDFLMFAVLDKTGKQLYSASPSYIAAKIGEIDLTQQDYLPAISSSNAVVLSGFDVQLGLPIAEMLYPLEDGNFLFGVISFYRTWLRTEQQRIDGTGRIYLVDAGGNIYMTRSGQEQTISPFYLNKAIESEVPLLKNLKGTDGKKYVGAIEPAPISGAYIAVLQDKGEAFSALNSITAFLIFFILAMALLSYLAAYSFAGGIADPISLLIAGAKRISKGNYKEQVPVDGNWKEFNGLIESFNIMMSDLENYKDLQVKQQVSEMKEFVFKSVAHDLRAPVQGLDGYVDLLASGKFSKEEEQNYIAIMKTALQEMLASLENILDVTMFQAGILKTDKESFDAGALIHNVTDKLKTLAQEKGLKIETKIKAQNPALGDKNLIARVLMNLVSNAIKFTEQGKITITYSAAAGNAVFTVADSGAGIKQDSLETIFEKYHQENETVKGYGLGLAISRQIVLAHGGAIKAENAKSGGAVFTFTLPLQ